MKRTGQIIKCKTCGNEKYKPAWLISRGNSFFCCKQCANAYTANLTASYQKNKSNATKEKIQTALLRHTITDKVKASLKKYAFQKGDKHLYWKGGISLLPWGPEFTQEKKLNIRTRDSFTCHICGKKEETLQQKYHKVLTVHHIDYNKLNNDEHNLITLCRECNNKVNFDRDNWPKVLLSRVDEIVRTA